MKPRVLRLVQRIPHPNTNLHHLGLKFLRLFVCLTAFASPTLHADTEGGTVRISWDPNPEKELAGYKVHYGTTSGSYDRTIDAGNSPTVSLTGLDRGTRYYVAVTAYNSLSIESDYSEEVTVVVEPPSFQPGNGLIVLLEAESGTRESPMTVGSGGGQSWISTPTAGEGLASISFDAPTSANYEIWCRYRTNSAGSPTVRAAFGTREEAALRLPATSAGVWTWGRLTVSSGDIWRDSLEQGGQSLHLRIGSTGLQIDRLILSSDPAFAATDALPRSGDIVSITSAPRNQTVAGGSTVTFSTTVAATGPVEFQWLKDGTPIEGATSSSLTVGPVTSVEAGAYTVSATSGTASATGGPALLAITEPPLAIRSLEISAPGNVTIQVDGAIGRELRVYASSDLETWELVGTRINAAGVITVEDPEAEGASKRFYRLSDDS